MNLANHRKNKAASGVAPVLTPALRIFCRNSCTGSAKVSNTIKLPRITLLIALNVGLARGFARAIFPWCNISVRRRLKFMPSPRKRNALPTQKPGQPFHNVIDHYILYNLSTNYKFSDNLKVTFGVNNLLNEEPPLSNQRLSSRVVFAQNIAKPIGRAFTLRAEYGF